MTTTSPCGCLATTFKNTSGGTMTFSFLPPHGRTLAADEEITVYGGPTECVTRSSYRAGKRNMDALSSALQSGLIEIIRTPCVIVYDESDAASYALGSNDGNVVTVAPWCDGSEGSSSSA